MVIQSKIACIGQLSGCITKQKLSIKMAADPGVHGLKLLLATMVAVILAIKKKFMKSTKKATGNKSKKKRWLLILILIFGAVFGYCVWLFLSLQGKFFLERISIPPDPPTGIVDYRFVVKTLDGFRVRTHDFARYYGDYDLHEENNFMAFSPNHEVNLEIISRNQQTSETILAIRGRTFDDFPVLTIVSYNKNKGEFHSIPFYVGNIHREIYFCAKEVLLKNLDDDPEMEVILGVLLIAEDGSSQVWSKTRYDYNTEKQAYLQTSATHEQILLEKKIDS